MLTGLTVKYFVLTRKARTTRTARNLLRVLMQRAAHEHRVSLSKLSFQRTLDSTRHFADAIQTISGKPRRQQELIEE